MIFPQLFINLWRLENIPNYYINIIYSCTSTQNYAFTALLTGCHGKNFLYSFLRDQPIWQSLRFWNAAFFDAVQLERSKRPVCTRCTSCPQLTQRHICLYMSSTLPIHVLISHKSFSFTCPQLTKVTCCTLRVLSHSDH